MWPEPTTLELADLASSRAAIHRWHGLLLTYPDPGTWSQVREGVTCLREAAGELAGFAFFPRLVRLLDGLSGASGEAPQEAYLAAFMARSRGSLESIPREAVQVSERPEEAGRVIAELETAYREAGFSFRGSGGQPADHAATEFEFLALLGQAEARAWSQGDEPAALLELRRAHAFLRWHLGAWFPAFASRCRRLALPFPYGPIVESAAAFIEHETDLIEAFFHE